MSKLAERIKEVRVGAGLSQLELAEIMGCSLSTVSKYEQGQREPNFEVLGKLAIYFNVSADYLLGADENPPQQTKLAMRLQALRGNKHIKQSDIADAIGISRISVSNYENGERKPDSDTIIKYSKFFNVTSDYLLGLSDSQLNTSMEISEAIELILNDSENLNLLMSKMHSRLREGTEQ